MVRPRTIPPQRVSDFIPALELYYSVFGLLLHSNLPLPGVVPIVSTANSPDIELFLGTSPFPDDGTQCVEEELVYESSNFGETGEPGLRIWQVAKGKFLRVAYSDGTQFWLDQKREALWAVWPGTLSLEDTATYLFGPVLGLLLRLRGTTCLHASAVAFKNRCVVFVGSAGAGKSTTAGAFARQGYGVLSDDIVALAEQDSAFHVMPAYPHLSLWPDSVKLLYGSSEALPRFTPDWDKRRLDLGSHGTRFENRSLPLGAIYVLGERRPDPAPYLARMRPQEALLALVAETYANKTLDREMRASEFAVLSRLVTTIPIRRVYAHADASKLETLCRMIREDFELLDVANSA
jgi:hypothetical protein